MLPRGGQILKFGHAYRLTLRSKVLSGAPVAQMLAHLAGV